MRSQNRWFHTVVVVGASLGGCGGQSARHVGGTDSGAGGSSGSGGGGAVGGDGALSGFGGSSGNAGGVTGPDDCSSDAEFVCNDYHAPVNCRCDESAPHVPTDCPSPFAFRCQEFWTGLATTPRYVGCTCAPTYVTPEDCATPRQLICDDTDHGLANCHCDPSLPTSPDECSRFEYWTCQSVDPEFGCTCHCCIIL